MTEKFCLSEKIEGYLIPLETHYPLWTLFLRIEDVKEAIRLIKLNPNKIDDIVGDKLI